MTRPFAAIERLLERLFERPAVRLFHASLQPIQIQRRLERAMDTGRVFSGDRAYVPTRYRVRLNPDDALGFDGFRQTLETELADALHARARARGYRLLARPTVAIEASARIQVADMDVISEMVDQREIEDGHGRDGARAPRGPHGTGVFEVGGVRAAPVVSPGWAPQSTMPQAPLPVSAHPSLSRPIEAADAAVYAAAAKPAAAAEPATAAAEPAAAAPTESMHAPMTPPLLARVEVHTRGTFMAAREFRGGTARIGRSTDNEIVLEDDRVSRRHGQLSARQGNLVFTDLGSTNGSFVNGTRVREIVLGSGDVVRLGNSTLTIQPHA
jgi:hypothetical protein